MAKSKHGKPDEYHLGEIRQLKAENKQLKRRLQQLERAKHIYHDLQDVLEPEEKPKKEMCKVCTRGELEELIIVGRLFQRCTICDYRSKAIKL